MTDEREDIVSVPVGVVVQKEGKKYVQVKNGEVVEEREVTTGELSSFGTIEIRSGLSGGETIVVP
jgi:hypothetical protein